MVHLDPGCLGCCPFWGGGSVVDLLFYVPPILCGGSVFVFVLAYVAMCPSFFTIILTRKRELVALLLFSFGCLVTVNFTVAFPHGAVGWSAICDCGIS